MAKAKRPLTKKPKVLRVCDINSGGFGRISPTRSKRTICIVFEDMTLKEDGAPSGEQFNVYVTGLRPELVKIPQDNWTPSEYWGAHAFQVIMEMVKATGAIHKVTKRGEVQ